MMTKTANELRIKIIYQNHGIRIIRQRTVWDYEYVHAQYW